MAPTNHVYYSGTSQLGPYMGWPKCGHNFEVVLILKVFLYVQAWCGHDSSVLFLSIVLILRWSWGFTIYWACVFQVTCIPIDSQFFVSYKSVVNTPNCIVKLHVLLIQLYGSIYTRVAWDPLSIQNQKKLQATFGFDSALQCIPI